MSPSRSVRVYLERIFLSPVIHMKPLTPLLLATSLSASELLTPTSTQLLSGTEFYPAANITNGSGLSTPPTVENYPTVVHSAASGSTSWTTDAPGGGSADYFALPPATAPRPAFLFTFPDIHDFTDFIYWGYHFNNPNGNEAKSFTLEFSSDGGNTFPDSLDLVSPAISQGAPTTLPFGNPFSANAIRLTVTDNWFEDFGGGDRAGLGEVRFLGVTAPNPNPVIDAQSLVDFGSFPSNPGTRTFNLPLANHGDINTLTVTPFIAEGGPFSSSPLPLSIPAGESVLLPVSFSSPVGGCFRDTLTLTTNDPLQPVVEITLLSAVNCTFPTPEQPEFSRDEGTFTEDFLLTLTSSGPEATILYTLDGSLPGPENGLVYDEAIPLTTTTQVRAASYYPGQEPAIRTRSYIRLASELASYTSELPIVIVDNFGGGNIPNKNWSTSSQTGGGLRQVARQSAFLGIFDRNPTSSTASISALPDQTSRIGIRVRGAFSSTWPRKPYSVKTWKTDEDSGRTIKILGMASDEDWILYYPDPGYDRSMLNNTFIWELSRQTGRWAPDFQFVDVFVNQDGGDLTLADRVGVYVFLEKPTRGSKRLDFDKLSDDGSTGGWLNSINRMDPIPVDGFPAENGATTPQFFHTAGRNRVQSTPPNTSGSGDDIPRQYNAFINFEEPNGYKITAPRRAAIEDWYRNFEDVFFDNASWRDPVQGYRRHLDTTDFIDYFQMLTLAKQGDGLLLSMFPWVSSDDRKLRMGPMWDFNNGAYGGSATGTLYFRPDRLWYDRLFEDPDFQREYEDRWFELRRGPLSNENMSAILEAQAAEFTVNLADQQAGISGSTWTSRVNSMKSWLQTRANWIDSNFLAPPSINFAGNSVTIAKPSGQTGTLYYSLDGRDPIEAFLPYTEPITLTNSALVSARLLTTEGDWSALISDTLLIGTPANAGNLVISEINYHPAETAPDTEFIELLNTSAGTIDLSLVHFTAGLVFEFPADTLLAPGERILVVQDQAAFANVYPDDHRIAGEFAEFTRLANSGEQLVLNAADGSVISDLTYNDKDPWPEFADGHGFSLTLINAHSHPDPNLAGNWRNSTFAGGSPGHSDATDPAPGHLTQHVLGGTPQTIANGSFHYRVFLGAESFLTIPQTSPDLIQWTDLPVPTQPNEISPEGFASYALPVPLAADQQFLRLKIRSR